MGYDGLPSSLSLPLQVKDLGAGMSHHVEIRTAVEYSPVLLALWVPSMDLGVSSSRQGANFAAAVEMLMLRGALVNSSPRYRKYFCAGITIETRLNLR